MKQNNYKYDAIIFDFDGVLVESVDVKTKAFAKLYAEYGEEIVKKVVEYHLKNGGISRYIKFRFFHKNFLNIDLSKEEETKLSKRFSSLVVDAVVNADWVSGAKEFLETYYNKISLFVASGTPDKELKEIIEKRKMGHFFISTHGTPATKSEIINSIMVKHGYQKNRVLMVGDAMADYEGAKQSGVDFVGRINGKTNVFPESTVKINNLRQLMHLLC